MPLSPCCKSRQRRLRSRPPRRGPWQQLPRRRGKCQRDSPCKRSLPPLCCMCRPRRSRSRRARRGPRPRFLRWLGRCQQDSPYKRSLPSLRCTCRRRSCDSLLRTPGMFQRGMRGTSSGRTNPCTTGCRIRISSTRSTPRCCTYRRRKKSSRKCYRERCLCSDLRGMCRRDTHNSRRRRRSFRNKNFQLTDNTFRGSTYSKGPR